MSLDPLPSSSTPGVRYRERLSPTPAVLALAVLGGAGLGLVLWVVAPLAGYVVGALAAVLLVTWLVVGSPVVVVEDGPEPVCHAGRARIEVELLGTPEVLDRAAMRRALGTDGDLRAYVCHRPWLHRGVRVTVDDPRDPAPYWLIASRRPAALAAALHGAGQAAHSEQTSWPPSS